MVVVRTDAGLGSRLKQYRGETGLSQAEVARRAGVSPGYLSDLEAGRGRRPSGEILHRLAGALDVTIAALLGRDIAPPEDPRVEPSLHDFVIERGLSAADAKMLASIRFRGDPPRTARRWAMIYDAIIASRSFDDDQSAR
jgi:transcriptional regulator with XRE-family HTH domain